jgi:ribulose-bisphosphate carboxylase large chain
MNMSESDKRGFFANRADPAMGDYLIFEYYFETIVDPEKAAAHLCQEQSTAQWKRVDVDEDLRDRFGAKVIELSVEKEQESPSYCLPQDIGKHTYVCYVRIAHPHGNFGPKLPNILTAAGGEGAFYSPGIPVIKLLDIEFPEKFLQAFQGPRFGIKGLRDILGVHDRPLFFGVIKPNIGLAPEPFAELAYQSWLGGVDIAKDDEMLCDVEWSPLSKRAKLLGEARKKSELETGKRKIYLANITDEVDRLIELHDIAVEAGANAVMVNGMTTGLSAVRMLRKHTQVPLVGHFDFIAPFTRIPFHGVHSRLMTKLQRLVGFDSIIMPGFGARMKTADDEVLENVQECFKPFGHIKDTLPVPAGSQWAGSTVKLYERLRTIDFGIVPGRGVFGHPMGPGAGAVSLIQGWESIQKGMTIEEYAEDHPELKAAIEAFS